MSQAKFLITGATGTTGGHTIRQLLGKNHAVRALAHRADDRSKRLQELGVEVVFGDFLDFDAIRTALKGVRGAYFCYPVSPGIVQAAAQFAQAAKEAGVQVIVDMSQKCARSDAKSVDARQHWLAERVFDWSGVPAVHLRPTVFAESLFSLAPMIRQGRMPVLFGSTGRHAPVAGEDQARVIVGILENPDPHLGNTYPLFGPVELTQPEIAAEVSKVLGKSVKYEHVSVEKFAEMANERPTHLRQNTSASLYSDPGPLTVGSTRSYVIQHFTELVKDHENGIFAGTNNHIAEIGGRPPMTVEEFVKKNREAFV
jgi:NAD(P)H dehydrogenase (quinone)